MIVVRCQGSLGLMTWLSASVFTKSYRFGMFDLCIGTTTCEVPRMITSRLVSTLGFAGAAAAITVFTATAATAAPTQLGEQGSTTLGAERLAGLAVTYYSYPETDYGDSRDGDIVYGFSMLGSNLLGDMYKIAATRAAAFLDRSGPRLAFDHFVRDGVSLGGSVMFSTTSTSDDDDDAVWSFGVTPRIGFASETKGGTTIWFKGGFTAVYGGVDDNAAYALDLNLQCDFVFPITDSFGWTLSPNVDVPLLAQQSSGPNDDFDDMRVTPYSMGINVGIVGWY